MQDSILFVKEKNKIFDERNPSADGEKDVLQLEESVWWMMRKTRRGEP